MMGLIRFLFSKEYLHTQQGMYPKSDVGISANIKQFQKNTIGTKEVIICQINNLIICWYQIVEILKVYLENWGEKFNLKPQSGRKS